MEKEVEVQFTDEVLLEAAKRFDLEISSLKKLGSFENYVYEAVNNGRSYILRLTHSSHRSTNMVIGELDWINYLSDNNVSVARAFTSVNGNLAEEIHVSKDYFIVCLFEKAKGKLLSRKNEDEFTREVIMEWGKVIGRMHKATKDYEPYDDNIRRPHWYEDDLLDFKTYLVDGDLIENGNKVLKHILNLPKGKDSYGLIHTDMHSGNFFVDNGKITVFDFDDSSYQYFASDIAIAIFYSVWSLCHDYSQIDKDNFAKRFFSSFMEGYNEENELDDYWLDQIPYFMMLRDINLYAVFHKKIGIDRMSEAEKLIVEDIKDRILKGVSIADIN